MTDVKQLTDRMIEKKKAMVQEQIQDAKLESETLILSEKKKLLQEKQEQQELIDQRLRRQYEQDKNALQIQKRNQLLSEKQAVLSKVFHLALEKMENWTNFEFREFLLSVLKQYKDRESIKLVLGEKSFSLISNEWIEQVAKKEIALEFSGAGIPKKSGFMLIYGGIEYNYCFDELMEDIKRTMVTSVSKQLFE